MIHDPWWWGKMIYRFYSFFFLLSTNRRFFFYISNLHNGLQNCLRYLRDNQKGIFFFFSFIFWWCYLYGKQKGLGNSVWILIFNGLFEDLPKKFNFRCSFIQSKCQRIWLTVTHSSWFSSHKISLKVTVNFGEEISAVAKNNLVQSRYKKMYILWWSIWRYKLIAKLSKGFYA